MVKCSAPLCGNSSYRKTPEITFHRFPKDENLKNAWLLNMNKKNWQPKSASVLCSKHFEAHLVDHSGIRTVLTSSAIPTIFDSSFQENISTSSLKGPVKRKAAGDQVLMNLQNLQPSTSSVIPHYNVPAPLLPVEPGPSKSVHCYICQMLMLGEKENFLCSLINKKDRGGLIYPSNGLIKIIQSCEKVLKMIKGNINYNSMMMYIADLLSNCSEFKTNDEHDFNHLQLLIKVIVKFYVDLRMKHNAKQSNLSERNYLKKIVLFRNK